MPKCTKCKKREATENMKSCQSCRTIQARRVRESRKRKLEKVERAAKEGKKLCVTCYRVEFSITDAFTTCVKCREKDKRRKDRKRLEIQKKELPDGMRRCTRCHRFFASCNYSQCVACRKKRRARKKKQREKAFQITAKDGHKICYHCLQEKPTKEFQSTIFRRKKLTSNCLSCRMNMNSVLNSENSKLGQCKKAWEDWKASHCCENCGTKECIEADHIDSSKKIHQCSSFAFWSWNGGPEALKKELLKCRPLCRFCHKLHTSKQQGRDDQVWKVKKRNYVNNIKMKIGLCELCHRKVENESMCCAFDFDHLDVETKRDCISKMVTNYRLADFFECIDEEVAKCRLLCANCHKKHTKEQQRKASVVSMID